jgi:benzylsuccinate CoA-transferase BbsF subunit
VISILAALRHKRRTGKGQRVELAQIESTVSCLGTALMDYTVNGRVQERAGNRIPDAAPHNAFRCQDLPDGSDRWCVIAVFDDQQWVALVGEMGTPGWAGEDRFQTLIGRKEYEDDLERLIGEWTRSLAAEDVMERLQRAGVPAGVVQNAEDMLERDPHMKARGYYRYLDHPETGRAAYDGPPARLSKTPVGPTRPAPLLGEHTAQVCTEVLGYSADELADLYAEGALT